MEVIVATVIATIAVLGLAYTFGMGRGFIDRFLVGRAALGAAQARLELLSVTPAADTSLTPVVQHQSYFIVDGSIFGTERWMVEWIDDPGDGAKPADKNPRDLRRLTVTVEFMQGDRADSVRIARLLAPQ